MSYPAPDSLPDSADRWLAYRYLTGELSDNEAAACEARLESDLPLQVALAECVELTCGLARLSGHCAVKSACSPSTVAGRDEWSRSHRRSPLRLAAAVGLLAVGLLFTSALITPRQMAWHDGEGHDSQVLDPSSVMAMWSELGDESDQSPDGGERVAKLESFSDDDLEIPDWMLVALLEEADEGDDDEPPQEQQL